MPLSVHAAMAASTPNWSVQQFDLLGRLRGDNRSAALLDPSAHPDATALSLFGSTPAAAKARCLRRRIVTVKSRVQCRPKFTYIVAPLSRTDKTLPSTNANRPRSAASPVRFSADKGAKFVDQELSPELGLLYLIQQPNRKKAPIKNQRTRGGQHIP